MKELALILVPLVGAAAALVWPANRTRPWLLPVVGTVHAALALAILWDPPAVVTGAWLGCDALARGVVPMISWLFLACAAYAVPYLRLRGERDNRVFVGVFLAILGLLSLALMAQHLGLLWVAAEAATLATVPLLHYSGTARAFEATWKYLLVGGTGIALSLLGSFCLGYASLHGGGTGDLTFAGLAAQGAGLTRPWVLAAWVLLLTGYGTKMGLAPMHTWKPDAYGEAPAHLFEREVWEQHDLVPEGHPWLKPVRRNQGTAPANGEFFRVEGREVHEVSVGPVHAGVIEPGHFRFQCAGEEVWHLEIALGYQHRGIEEAITGGPHRATLAKMETIAGDSTIAHATAHALVGEALAGTEAPLRAQWLRALALELERLANHAGDLGALANDVAFLPTAAACGKIRGDFLNLTALVCGNRFGRGLVRPGGCRHDLDADRGARLAAQVSRALAETEEATAWLWDSGSVRARFEGTGVVSDEQAAEIGLVGPAARACGLVRDVRYDHPAGWHRFAQTPVAVWPGGDVFARARVRALELQRSGAFLAEQLAAGPDGPMSAELPPMAGDTLAVALTEGWRGETCHAALTDGDGKFRRYKIVDPSFHNWTGLALAMRGQAISDFPICNKSFNLSYCGFDL